MCDYVVPTLKKRKCAKKGLVWAVRAASRTAKRRRQAKKYFNWLFIWVFMFVVWQIYCDTDINRQPHVFLLYLKLQHLCSQVIIVFKLCACICEKSFQFMSGMIPRMSSKDAQKVYITDLQCHKRKFPLCPSPVPPKRIHVSLCTAWNAPFISKVIGHKG